MQSLKCTIQKSFKDMLSGTGVEKKFVKTTKHTLNPLCTDISWNLVTGFNEETTLDSKT